MGLSEKMLQLPPISIDYIIIYHIYDIYNYNQLYIYIYIPHISLTMYIYIIYHISY